MKIAPLLLLTGMVPAIALGALRPEPAVIPDQAADVAPVLNIGIAHDSNLYTEPSGLQDESLIFTINPAVMARSGDDEEYDQLSASVTRGLVAEESDDNFTDYRFGYDGRYAPLGNFSVVPGFAISQGHDPRGSGSTDTCQVGTVVLPAVACDDEPDVYRDISGRLAGTLGVEESRGRITAGISGSSRRYSNNEPRTDFLDYNQSGAQLKFAWRITGKTDAVLEANYSRYNYLEGDVADSNGLEYLAGVEWDMTAKTTGYAKFGVQEKDFKDPTRDDLDDSAWRAGLRWVPTEGDMVNLEASRNYQESNGIGTAKVVTGYSARASHLMFDRIEPYVRFEQTNIEYEGVNRSDDVNDFGVGVDYKFRRYAVFGFAWSRTEATSDAGAALEYDRDIFALTANLSL